MTPERWRKIKEVFQAALDLDPSARPLFIDNACADDPELRREVDSLILAHDQTLNIVDQPIIQIAAKLIDDSQPASLIGRSLAHYTITQLIGQGGMGEVYLAEDSRLGRRVALKILPARFSFDQERVRRFQQEARAASALNHPNIVTIHEMGQQDDQQFIVTEYIEGSTIRAMMSDEISLDKALDVAIQVANALAAAHQ